MVLLLRIILSTSNVGETILDPFFGSGTTGAVAKRLQRNFIGIEKEKFYVEIANKRIDKIIPIKIELLNYDLEIKPPKVPFGNLIEKGFIKIGENIYSKNKQQIAVVNANASISLNGFVGSIHKVSANILNKKSHNGWKYWHIKREDKLILIDELRSQYIEKYLSAYQKKEKTLFQVSEPKTEYKTKINNFLEDE